jgi:hypothetical protein
MIGLLEPHPGLPIVAAIIVFVMGFTALFAFAILYFDLYRFANGLATRTSRPDQDQLAPGPIKQKTVETPASVWAESALIRPGRLV